MAVLAFVCVAAGYWAWFKFANTYTVILVSLPPFLLVLRFLMTLGRTIIMDKEGCTIKFLGIKQTYKWDDLKTKKIITVSEQYGFSQPWTKGAIFSPFYLKNPLRLMPFEYNSLWLSPSKSLFGYFFVHFDNDEASKMNYKSTPYPGIYLVDETIFMKLMKEWGVDIKMAGDGSMSSSKTDE